MILLRTALLNFKKSLIMNLFTILEMTATILIFVIMVSSILIRYEYYEPFKDMFKSKGLYCEFTSMANSSLQDGSPLTDFINDDEIFTYLNNPEKIAACNEVMASVDIQGEEGKSSNNYCYNDELISRFTPRLKEGRWLNTSDKATTLEIVISENDYGWEVGDKLNILFFNYPDSTTLEAEVVGILEDSTKVPGGFQVHNGNDNFNLFYTPYSFEIEEIPLVLFSSEYLDKLDTPTEIVQGLFSGVIITYPDDVTDEQLKSDQQLLNTFGCAFSESLEDMETENSKYLYTQVYNLLPIIIVILILTLVSSISSTALSTRRRLRDYSIYYITGLQWRHCVLVNLIQSAIISVISVLLSFAAIYVIRFTALSESVRIIWNSWTILSIFGLILIYMLISMLMPIIIIGKSTPKQILTR